MAEVRRSQWSLPMARMVEAAKGDVETVVRKVTLDLFRKVVLRSPVDTGRFRANWNVSYGTPDVTVTASKIKSRGDAEAAKALTLPVGGVTWLANGLPYSERLEYGWSKQAPGGMVRLATAEFASIASKAKP